MSRPGTTRVSRSTTWPSPTTSVFEAIARDESLVAFLSAQGRATQTGQSQVVVRRDPAEHRRADPARHGGQSPEDRVELSDHGYHDRHDPDRAGLAGQPRRSDGDSRPDHRAGHGRRRTVRRERHRGLFRHRSAHRSPSCWALQPHRSGVPGRRCSSVIRSCTRCTASTSTPGAWERTTRAQATREHSRSSVRTTPA